MYKHSWQSPDHPLNAMLYCGGMYDGWVIEALKYLPSDIMEELRDKVAFFSTGLRDGCRISRAICEQREIILLSERILPSVASGVDESRVKYFIFTVLHELAHVLKKHGTPKFDGLSEEENQAQEQEAEALAFSWFNGYVEAVKNPALKPLTWAEVDQQKKRNQELQQRGLDGLRDYHSD